MHKIPQVDLKIIMPQFPEKDHNLDKGGGPNSTNGNISALNTESDFHP